MVKLCKKWGAIDFDLAMLYAARGGYVEIVKLCREWLGFGLIHDEIFSLSHKRQFSRKKCEELLGILIACMTGVLMKKRKGFWRECGNLDKLKKNRRWLGSKNV